MTRRVKKQLIYGTAYLAAAAGIATAAYFLFLKPVPSCSDTIQNQGELAVDCGGPCSRVCSPSVQPIRPLELVDGVLILEPNAGHISVLAKVTNPNLAYAARNFLYEFKMFDTKGVALESIRGTSFIYSGEMKYILAPNVSRVDASRIEFTTDGAEWVSSKGEGENPPSVTVSGTGVRAEGGTIFIEGAILNEDIISVPRVTILGTFFGSVGQIVGASETEVTDLSPGETKKFSIIHPMIEGADLAATKIFPYAKRP